ncbi:MAG: CAP domain-containing protein [Hydrogenophaga sp.]|nr:CAP domain-containing protein [Hydrogenophaga sp.]
MLLVGCGGGDASDEPTHHAGALPATGLVALEDKTSCALPDFKDALLQQINAARASARTCGTVNMPAVGGLAWNDRLFSAAARHSDDMARHNYFSHTGRDGRSPGQRVSAEGYSWRIAGENIAAGQTSVHAVMTAWLASPGHCENLMRSAYTEVGVACVVAPSGSTYSRYWTMKLAQPGN